YADIIAWLFIGVSALRRYEAEGRRREDLPLVDYGATYALAQIQRAYEGLYENFDGPVGLFLRTIGRLWVGLNPLAKMPDDKMTHKAAQPLQRYDEQFLRLYEGMYLPQDSSKAMGRLLDAFRKTQAAEPVRNKIRNAQKQRKLPRGSAEDLVDAALDAGVITSGEHKALSDARDACLAAIEVDVFTHDEFVGKAPHGLTATGDGGAGPQQQENPGFAGSVLPDGWAAQPC